MSADRSSTLQENDIVVQRTNGAAQKLRTFA